MRWTAGDREQHRGHAVDARGRRNGARSGIGGFIIVALLSMFTGVDFFSMLGGGSAPSAPTAVGTSGRATSTGPPAEERTVDMVDAVARDAQETWQQHPRQPLRADQGRAVPRQRSSRPAASRSRRPGRSTARATSKVYLDLGFFDELQPALRRARRLRAGLRARARDRASRAEPDRAPRRKVRQLQRADPASGNALSVRLELQADCYAGVWGHSAAAAGAQRRARSSSIPATSRRRSAPPPPSATIACSGSATGRVMPEKFTHGISEQRVTWFKRGFDSGDPKRLRHVRARTAARRRRVVRRRHGGTPAAPLTSSSRPRRDRRSCRHDSATARRSGNKGKILHPAVRRLHRLRFDRSIVEGPIAPAVWRLAWPTVLQNVIGGLQGIVDHVMVGHYVGFTGNAAIGVSWQIFLVVIVFIARCSPAWACWSRASPARTSPRRSTAPSTRRS